MITSLRQVVALAADASWCPPFRVAEGGTMKRRLVAATILAVLVFAGLTTAALAMPSVCPAATHASGSVCLSDGIHPAPSGSGMIPDYSTGRDARRGLRIGVGVLGAALAAGIVHVGRRDPEGAELQPA
jgi:hypothetical protein